MSSAPNGKRADLSGALAQWRRVLGADRVRADPSTLHRYVRTTLKVLAPGRYV